MDTQTLNTQTLNDVKQVEDPKLLIASRIFGASGQPWLWRQVVGVRGFRKHLLCWERRNTETQPVVDFELIVLAGDPAPYDGAGRWLHRLRNLPRLNFYAAAGSERRNLKKLLRRERPAVILCNFGDIAMRMLPVAMQEGIPVVAHSHGDFVPLFLNNRWFRWSMLRCIRQFAAVVVVNQAERQWLLQQGVDEDRIHVIPCGAPTEIFRPGLPMPGPVRFAMVSRLVGLKGCDVSIRAFAAVIPEVPGAELHVYGDGPIRADLEHLVESLGLKARVFFHGYVNESRLAAILPSYDVFIQHTLQSEGSSVSIAEAMACALPVVATLVGGIPEQVMDGKTGFLVAEMDVQGMTAAMRRLALDPALRKTFGHLGRQRAVETNDSSLQARRLGNVLTMVGSEPRATGVTRRSKSGADNK